MYYIYGNFQNKKEINETENGDSMKNKKEKILLV